MKTFFIATIHGGGSVFRYFHALGRELVSRGHRVVMIVDGQAHGETDEQGNPSILTWPSKTPTKWRDAVFLNSLITRYGPSCIISNFSAVNICSLVGWLRRVPARVAWSHTMTRQIEMDTDVSSWKRALLNRRRRMIYRFATQLVANSKAMSMDLQKMFRVSPGKIEIVYFLLPEPPCDLSAHRENMIVYVGRLSRSKGDDVLLRALPRIIGSCPDVTVEFLGKGPEQGNCESTAESLDVLGHCRFRGAVPLETVYERMSSAAIQVSMSIHEAFGLVNLEAHSVGTPAVASDVDGIREVVIDGETGFLFPPGDSDALSDKVIRLLQDDELRARMGRAARLHFERKFSSRHMSSHADCFESLASDS